MFKLIKEFLISLIQTDIDTDDEIDSMEHNEREEFVVEWVDANWHQYPKYIENGCSKESLVGTILCHFYEEKELSEEIIEEFVDSIYKNITTNNSPEEE